MKASRLLCLASALCLASTTAMAFETHASLSAGTGYNYFEQHSYTKAGFTLSAPIGLGLGWWSYTGGGENAKQESWVSHTQGLDWTISRLTTTVSYKFSKDPNHFTDKDNRVQEELGLGVKVRLW